MILVDTNLLSELARPMPEPRVIAWLEVDEPALALPAIALAELRYGIARLPDGRRRPRPLHFWRATSSQSAAESSRSTSAPPSGTTTGRRRGTRSRRLNIQDAQSAATALVHPMSVAKHNDADFEAVA